MLFRSHENKWCKKKPEIRKFKCNFCSKEFDTLNGARYHEDKWCKSKNKGNCFRCGRYGHLKSECKAIKHMKGYYIK